MMTKIEKAKDLFLRGFRNDFIKKSTGFSTVDVRDMLRKECVPCSSADIVNYQVEYIKAHYSNEDVVSAYIDIIQNHVDPYHDGRLGRIFALDCCFGAYAKVVPAIIGLSEYKQLKVRCWKEKQISSVMVKYGVKNVFELPEFQLNPMANLSVKEKRRQTMLVKYGVEHPNQNPEIKAKMRASMVHTNMERYGVPDVMMVSEVAQRSADKRQEVMFERYGARNSVEIPNIRNAIFESRRKNGTLCSSRCEDTLYELLVGKFGVDDVIRNSIIDNRYPWHVDFYVKSRDLFIEMNGDKCHNGHWFDDTSIDDLEIVACWEEQVFLSDNRKSSRYRRYIETWTKSDVEKRQTAQNNHLNYLVFWDSRTHRVNGETISRLSDARGWFDAGCPDSFDYLKENTY